MADKKRTPRVKEYISKEETKLIVIELLLLIPFIVFFAILF